MNDIRVRIDADEAYPVFSARVPADDEPTYGDVVVTVTQETWDRWRAAGVAETATQNEMRALYGWDSR